MTGLTSKISTCLGHQGKGEVYFMIYYCLELHIYYGAPKSFKWFGPLRVLIWLWVHLTVS